MVLQCVQSYSLSQTNYHQKIKSLKVYREQEGLSIENKKAFQSKANCPLSNQSLSGEIQVNKIEHVREVSMYGESRVGPRMGVRGLISCDP